LCNSPRSKKFPSRTLIPGRAKKCMCNTYAVRHGTEGSGSRPAAAALVTPVLPKRSKQSNGTYLRIMVYGTIIGFHELKTAHGS